MRAGNCLFGCHVSALSHPALVSFSLNQVYYVGLRNDGGGSRVTIDGGTFNNNGVLCLGDTMLAWGTSTIITTSKGKLMNNISESAT